jgi:hypothetical protein
LVRGGSALEALAADLQSLQRNVETLTATVNELRDQQHRSSQRQLDDLDAIRGAVAEATDDLVARVNAIDERTRSTT